MSEFLIKCLGLCLISAVFCVVLRQKSGEYSIFIGVAAGCLVLILTLKAISSPIKIIRDMLEENGVNSEYFKVAIKAVGIGYLTNFIADTCRDSGQASLASKAEFAGKCAIFILSLPLVVSVLETAVGFIK